MKRSHAKVSILRYDADVLSCLAHAQDPDPDRSNVCIRLCLANKAGREMVDKHGNSAGLIGEVSASQDRNSSYLAQPSLHASHMTSPSRNLLPASPSFS